MKNSSNYDVLARSLWAHLAQDASASALAQLLGTRSSRIRAWEKGERPIRASTWCLLARKKHAPLGELTAAVLVPRPPIPLPHPFSARAARTAYVGPLLRQLRSERTLAEVQALLGLKTWSSYHHWETGIRDIPLARLLEAIDVLGSRLQTFCEALGFARDLSEFGLVGAKADFSERFFALPWTPTVFLAVQTETYQKQRHHDDLRLARQLGFTPEQVVQALQTLADLELVRFDSRLYRPRRGQFYAPPTLTPSKLEQLQQFWFQRSEALSRQPGLHKIEEHALSRESMNRITGWIADLRERIRAEVAQSTPETVVHIHWQLAEMLPKK